MCDEELIAAILEDLGYLDEKKKSDKKLEVDDEDTDKHNQKNSGKEK